MNLLEIVESALSNPLSILVFIAFSALIGMYGWYRKDVSALSDLNLSEEATSRKSKGNKLSSFCIENIWTILVICGLLVFCSILQTKVNFLETKIDVAPKIAVIDFTRISVEFTKRSGSAVTPESLRALDELLVKTKEVTDKLVKSGYVVIDSQFVTGAPADTYITVEDLKSYAAN